MRKTYIASLIIILIGAAACGDSPDGGTPGDAPDVAPQDGVVNTGNARGCVDELGKLSASMSAMDATKVARSIQTLLLSCQLVVAPKIVVAPTYGPVAVTFGNTVGPPDGTGICTATSCTFTNYTAQYPLIETYQINGSITRSGDATLFAINYDQTGKFGSMQWDLDGTVTSTTTQLDGTVHSHGTTGGPYTSLHVTWDVTVDFMAVTLDAQACPTGGSMRGLIRYHDDPTVPFGDAPPRSPSFDVLGAVTFGPTCNAVP